MSVFGALLTLGCALYIAVQMRKNDLEQLQMGENLLEELAVLRRAICSIRTPLPLVLRQLICRSTPSAGFWQAFLSGLSAVSVEEAWSCALRDLPAPLQEILRPLGSFLSTGGAELGRIIDEIREELTEYLHTQRQEQASRSRTRTALCLSAAGLAVLVMI